MATPWSTSPEGQEGGEAFGGRDEGPQSAKFCRSFCVFDVFVLAHSFWCFLEENCLSLQRPLDCGDNLQVFCRKPCSRSWSPQDMRERYGFEPGGTKMSDFDGFWVPAWPICFRGLCIFCVFHFRKLVAACSCLCSTSWAYDLASHEREMQGGEKFEQRKWQATCWNIMEYRASIRQDQAAKHFKTQLSEKVDRNLRATPVWRWGATTYPNQFRWNKHDSRAS